MLAAFSELTTASRTDLVVVTGLPVAFYSDKEMLRDRFLGEHRVVREGRRTQVFRVSRVRVIPQPFGSLLSVALDDKGTVADLDLSTGRVGVIDVGGKTTNLLSAHRLAEVGRETASVSVGAWDAVRAVRAFLSERCPGQFDLRDHQVADVIASRGVSYYGERLDLSAEVDDILSPMADQVIAQATQLWNGGAGLDAVLVTGGGALLLGEAIKGHFPHARIVDEPVFANAIGYWKLAQRLG
jgi:plasmid segregation protein ParM